MNEDRIGERVEPTLVPANEAAIVTTGNMTDWELLIPKLGPDDIVPQIVLFMLACYLRGDNEEKFWNEMMDWIAKEMPGNIH